MQLDLSTLSGPELRQMLDATRGRGQAAQSYEILQEMARRRGEGAQRRRRAGRKAAEPRIIEVDLGDPRERDDIEDQFDDPTPERPLELAAATPPPRPPRPPRRLPWLAAGLAVGVAAGVAVGVQMDLQTLGLSPAAAGEPVSAAPAARPPAPVDVAAEFTPPSPAPRQLSVEVAPEPAPAPLVEAAGPAEAAQPAEPAVQVAEAPPVAPPVVEKVAVVETRSDVVKVCAGAATPADRAICADPDLQDLQKRLRRAYAEALDAHADRTLLRERQLAWRDERNGISDPERLAQLYKARIRKLQAATADARRQRSG